MLIAAVGFLPFVLGSFGKHILCAPYLFRFGKFCSFLLGNFGAPDLVIKKKDRRKGTVQNQKKGK